MIYKPYLYHFGIKGMKWGRRRYQNEDGSLTNLGKSRYDRDVRENNAKKKDNRIIIDGPDPDRWVREDLTRKKKVLDSSSTAINQLKNVKPTKKRPAMDLSGMSDEELRAVINRKNLEKQYSNLMDDGPAISRGEAALQTTLDVAGSVLAISSSAVGLALAIKELKG